MYVDQAQPKRAEGIRKISPEELGRISGGSGNGRPSFGSGLMIPITDPVVGPFLL
jgi:hypothetical protein